ncbi:hypothetical protein [Anaeromyxobacter diazotrophicus]|uniref:Cytochrome c domain-containing protein n=1 Tax=Anaeromyxobacter diazotrophicus TaxID=2590199 RepID=A0A7I9VLV6_9BACT|nr:hypothetical protein [Anaeromyxobacter diazotrophicus]GEJ56967.1 hypothetical protein AMYX_17080 [Anaeromyxobacter diazotrophicus]
MLGSAGRTLTACAALLAAAPALAVEPPAGDPGPGRRLFIGAQRLAAGGPPCGACHAIGGQGAAFAAALGPELTRSFDGMPREAVDGLLQDLPFPTMAPLYAGRALTEGERRQLAVFLLDAAGKPAPGGGPLAAWAALLTALALLGLGLARRRGGSIHSQLLAGARRRHGGAP